MADRAIPANFVKNVLNNGVGRYVCQLQRLTLFFCKSTAASRGVRDFIENELIDFTRVNPGIVVYLQPKRHKIPLLRAEYLNGNVYEIPVPCKDKIEVGKWIHILKLNSGIKSMRLLKYQHTDSPSIQGIWTPFTNKSTYLNVTKFPSEELSAAIKSEKSATEILLERAEKLRHVRKDKDKSDAVYLDEIIAGGIESDSEKKDKKEDEPPITSHKWIEYKAVAFSTQKPGRRRYQVMEIRGAYGLKHQRNVR